jgi:hypothetical protein
MILLQIDLTFGDEAKSVYEGCYETKDISISAGSSVSDIGHNYWLRGSIRQLLFNNKANYLVRSIRRILNFLQLWIIIMA